MILSYSKDGSVLAKTKTSPITFTEDNVLIGDFTVPGAGEFDVAGVQCEGTYLEKGRAFFLHAEALTLTFISECDSSVSKSDEASNTNILIASINSETKPDQLKPILKSLEPSYLFCIGAGATSDFIKALGLSDHDDKNLKITKAGLPEEGTYVLTA